MKASYAPHMVYAQLCRESWQLCASTTRKRHSLQMPSQAPSPAKEQTTHLPAQLMRSLGLTVVESVGLKGVWAATAASTYSQHASLEQGRKGTETLRLRCSAQGQDASGASARYWSAGVGLQPDAECLTCKVELGLGWQEQTGRANVIFKGRLALQPSNSADCRGGSDQGVLLTLCTGPVGCCVDATGRTRAAQFKPSGCI